MVLSAPDLVKALQELTNKSVSAQGPADQITVVNVAMAVSGLGPIPIVITRLTDMITFCGTTIAGFAGTKAFAKSEQDSVLVAFRDFVKVHKDLQNILIAKGKLVPQLMPFIGPPMAAVLRQLESVIDTIAFELIDTCEDVSKDLTAQKDSLDAVIVKSIETWSGQTPL